MVRAIGRRGPDGSGVVADPDAGLFLGHARLAIIDPSAAGAQPMSFEGGRFCITYNGELYNHDLIRGDLLERGHKFSTASDTEIILAAYREWGAACLQRFVGMFAFVLVDRYPPHGGPEAFVARDRLGIKPLLFARPSDQHFVFGSEIKAFLVNDDIRREVNRSALADFLASGATFQPESILTDVRALRPGCFLEIRNLRGAIDVKETEYWDLHGSTIRLREELARTTEAEARARLADLLRESARAHLVSDVPVGAFLSGGLDSAAAVGMLQEAKGGQLQTFTIGFSSKHTHFDEAEDAAATAKHLGSRHTSLSVSDAEIRLHWDSIVRDIDQPSADGVNTWLVSKLASSDVKVAISGLGADEVFGGYRHFGWRIASRPAVDGSGRAIREASQLMVRPAHALRPNRFTLRLLRALKTGPQRMASVRREIPDEMLSRVLRPEWGALTGARVQSTFGSLLPETGDGTQAVSHAEIKGYLVSTLLRDVDAMSMAHGVEVRPVFLHHPLVEFGYSLPGRLKVDGAARKIIFRHVVDAHVAPAVRARAKRGFEMPTRSWMAGALRSQAEMALEGETARALFRPDYLCRARARLAAGNPLSETWAWMVLASWLAMHRLEVPDPRG